MNEVRLIPISAIQRQLRPIDALASIRAGEGSLKAPNPAVALWCHAHLRCKSLDEALCAHANGVRYCSNIRGKRNAVKRGERKLDRRMPTARPQSLLQRVLDRIELTVRIIALEELFA
jgi:hypothetical protein